MSNGLPVPLGGGSGVIPGRPPPSNIMGLMQLGGMGFSITNNGGWYDILTFPDPTNTSKPLDLTGIDFHAELRTQVGDPSNRLDMKSSISNPQFRVGGNTGTLFFTVDVSLTQKLSPGMYVMDMLAIDMVTGMVRNLCEGGPINVTVLQGITL
jgi:hypothetical protein